ncbi:MAG: VanW family protein [Anaerolineae bacterium]
MKTWLVVLLTRLARLLLISLLVGTIGAGILWINYQTHYQGRIFKGVSIGGISVGGLTTSEAITKLEQELSAEKLPFLVMTSGERSWTVSSSKLGADLYIEPAVTEAIMFGRAGTFRSDLLTQLRLLLYGYYITPQITFEPGTMLVYLRELATNSVLPSRAAQFIVQGLEISTNQEQAGQEVDYAATQQTLQRTIMASMGDGGWGREIHFDLFGGLAAQAQVLQTPLVVTVPVSIRSITPPLANFHEAQERARLLLSTPISLSATIENSDSSDANKIITQTWVIDQARLASWLVVKYEQTSKGLIAQVTLNEAKIQAYVQTLDAQISRPPHEGLYAFNPLNQTIEVLKPAMAGYSLDKTAALDLLLGLCLSEKREGILPLRSIQPVIRLADLQAMLPLDLIGEGETQYRGSTTERFLNIRRASEQFKGVVVPPKATFSFLAELGPVTIANGYSESWVIYGNKTILGPGGGVCQVATTLFRAAFYGGFPIVERTPHSYRISRYEPPVGLDAAVFSPSTDFKFMNDLETPIIITNEIDEVRGIITFRIYGRAINRTVRVENNETSREIKAGDPILEVDLKLAPGDKVLVEESHDGIDAVLTRVIELDGKIIKKEQFYSRYVPWPARYRVGPSKP